MRRVQVAELYIASAPECPQHGPMKARPGSINGYTATVYVCPGFDGEGCDYEAPAAEWKHIGWVQDV